MKYIKLKLLVQMRSLRHRVPKKVVFGHCESGPKLKKARKEDLPWITCLLAQSFSVALEPVSALLCLYKYRKIKSCVYIYICRKDDVNNVLVVVLLLFKTFWVSLNGVVLGSLLLPQYSV